MSAITALKTAEELDRDLALIRATTGLNLRRADATVSGPYAFRDVPGMTFFRAGGHTIVVCARPTDGRV